MRNRLIPTFIIVSAMAGTTLLAGPAQAGASAGPSLVQGAPLAAAAQPAPAQGLYAWGDTTTGISGTPRAGSVHPSPFTVDWDVDVAQIAHSGGNSTVVLDTDGYVWNAGENRYGELGDTRTETTTLSKVAGIKDATFVVGAAQSAVAVKKDGTVWQWGRTLDLTGSMPATQVPGLSGVTEVAAGSYHYAAIDSAKRLWTWGRSNFSLVPYGAVSTPAQIELPSVDGVATVPAKVYASAYTTFVIDTKGRVWDWGRNLVGERGFDPAQNGDTATPTLVPGLPAVTKLVTSGFVVWAYDKSGNLWTWGSGLNGDTFSDTNYYTPKNQGPSYAEGSAVGIETGTVRLLPNGTVQTIVRNNYGTAGNGLTDQNEKVITTVPGITNAVALGSTRFGVYAATADGRVYAWGDELTCGTEDVSCGAFGVGTYPEAKLSPTRIGDGKLGGSSIVQMEAKDNTAYYRTKDGSVWASGGGEEGEIGATDTRYVFYPQAVPARVKGAVGATDIAAGVDTGAYVFTADGSAGGMRTWGEGSLGEMGNDANSDSDEPVAPHTWFDNNDLTGVAEASSGQNFTLVRMADTGEVYGFGDNSKSQLAWEASAGTNYPDNIDSSDGEGGYRTLVAASIGTGYDTGYAVLPDKTVVAWGSDFYGQVGPNGTGENMWPALPVTGITNATQVTGSREAGFAVDEAGQVWSWGENHHGVLGQSATTTVDATSYAPGLVAGLPPIAKVVAGEFHVLAITKTGDLYAWGDNEFGQLGTGDTTTRFAPVKVPGLSKVTEAYASAKSSGALATGAVPAVATPFSGNTATVLTLKVTPKPVKVGAKVTVAGTLTQGTGSGAVALGGQSVALSFNPTGSRPAAKVATVKTAANGSFTFSLGATRDGVWTASFARNGSLAAASSPGVAVDAVGKIPTKATANAAPEPITKGKTLTIKGTVSHQVAVAWEPLSAATVTIWFDPAGSALPAKQVAKVKTTTKGTYSYSAKATRDGYWLVKYAGSTTIAAATSPKDYVNVSGKASTKITLNASPEPVRAGATVTASGKLTQQVLTTYAPFVRASVAIYFDPKGSKPAVKVATVKTTSTGAFSYKAKAKLDGTWSARYLGSSTHYAVKAKGDYVDVR